MKRTDSLTSVMVDDKDRLNVICALVKIEAIRSGKSTDYILGTVTAVIRCMEEYEGHTFSS